MNGLKSVLVREGKNRVMSKKVQLFRRARFYKKDPTCALCGEHIEDVRKSNIDHIVPKSKGGSNSNSNLQLTHKTCNRAKGDSL